MRDARPGRGADRARRASRRAGAYHPGIVVPTARRPADPQPVGGTHDPRDFPTARGYSPAQTSHHQDPDARGRPPDPYASSVLRKPAP